MKTKISKWGNSLGIRIPQAFVEELGISDSTQVDIQLRDGTLVIEPYLENFKFIKQAVEAIDIDKLSAKVNKQNKHSEFSFERVGEEIW